MEKLVKAMQKSGGKKKREEDEGQKQRWGARESRGLCKGEREREGRGNGRKGGGREGGEEVNLHILERAGFFIKKRLKLIYACALLTHCTL